MDLEEEEAVHILPEPVPCAVSEVEATARMFGVTCQTVFERAYARIQHVPSFARAVFARYLATHPSKRMLPAPVKEYCATRKKNSNGVHSQREGFCIGCMLNRQGLVAISHAYPMIHPESEKHDTQATPETQEDLPEIEKLWLDLLESGVLDGPHGSEGGSSHDEDHDRDMD
jgi:hypothetical protein